MSSTHGLTVTVVLVQTWAESTCSCRTTQDAFKPSSDVGAEVTHGSLTAKANEKMAAVVKKTPHDKATAPTPKGCGGSPEEVSDLIFSARTSVSLIDVPRV